MKIAKHWASGVAATELALGKGWSPLELVHDKSTGVVRIGQAEGDVYLPKGRVRQLIKKLEAVERKLA